MSVGARSNAPFEWTSRRKAAAVRYIFEHGLSERETAERLGCSHRTLRRFLDARPAQ